MAGKSKKTAGKKKAGKNAKSEAVEQKPVVEEETEASENGLPDDSQKDVTESPPNEDQKPLETSESQIEKPQQEPVVEEELQENSDDQEEPEVPEVQIDGLPSGLFAEEAEELEEKPNLPEEEAVPEDPFDFSEPDREPTGKLVEITIWKNQHGTQRLDDPDLQRYSDNGFPSIVIGDSGDTPEGQKLPLIEDDWATERSRKEVVRGTKVLLVPRILKQARKSGLTATFKEVTNATA